MGINLCTLQQLLIARAISSTWCTTLIDHAPLKPLGSVGPLRRHAGSAATLSAQGVASLQARARLHAGCSVPCACSPAARGAVRAGSCYHPRRHRI